MKQTEINKEKKVYPRWYNLLLIIIPVIFFLLLEFFLTLFKYGTDYTVFTKPYSSYPNSLFLNPRITQKYFTNVSSPPTTIADGFSEIKSPSTYRVFVLGESSAAGWPYVPNASFPRILKRKLQLYFPESNIEVINLGISAINTYTIKDLVPAVLEQKPDLILIYTGHNEYYGALGVASSQNLGNSSFLIDLYISLQSYKTFQLVSSFLNYISSIFSSNSEKLNASQNETLMERMVGNNLIEYNSDLYYGGINQFENNMWDILSLIKKEKVPVILGTLVSNLSDLEPFESLPGSSPSADSVFLAAKEELSKNNLVRSKKLFYLAKDLDALRFRAPLKINDIIISLSEEFECPFIDLDYIFNSHSPHGVTGYNLTVDHLHPNVTGYSLIADSFFDKILELNLQPKSKITSLSHIVLDSISIADFPFTELDSAIASLRVKILTGAYPFAPRGSENLLVKNFIPKNIIDSLAIEVVDRWMIWEKAHYSLSERYYNQMEFSKAAKELKVLIEDRPLNPSNYKELINLFISVKDYTESVKYLQKLQSFNPDAFTYKWMGSIALENKDYQAAIVNLQKSLDFSQTDPQVWYNLAGAYYMTNNVSNAKYAIKRCLELNPQNPAALSFLEQLNAL
ncbi:MAG: tetratricopeptide repeat protein [Ignavibacteriaceae bacterium]